MPPLNRPRTQREHHDLLTHYMDTNTGEIIVHYGVPRQQRRYDAEEQAFIISAFGYLNLDRHQVKYAFMRYKGHRRQYASGGLLLAIGNYIKEQAQYDQRYPDHWNIVFNMAATEHMQGAVRYYLNRLG